MENIKTFFNFTSNKIVYCIVFVIAAFLCYMGYTYIQLIPKPGTFSAMFNYLIHNTDGYGQAALYTFAATLFCWILGISTLVLAGKLHLDDYANWICIVIAIVGVVIAILGLYFLNYCFIVLTPALAIIAVVVIYAWLSNQ